MTTEAGRYDDLIERLEKAAGQDRVLDWWINHVINYPDNPVPNDGTGPTAEQLRDADASGIQAGPHYTGSRDAAQKLLFMGAGDEQGRAIRHG